MTGCDDPDLAKLRDSMRTPEHTAPKMLGIELASGQSSLEFACYGGIYVNQDAGVYTVEWTDSEGQVHKVYGAKGVRVSDIPPSVVQRVCPKGHS